MLRYKHTGNSEAVSIINDIRLRLSKAKNGLNGLPYMLIVSVAKNPSNPLKPLYIYIIQVSGVKEVKEVKEVKGRYHWDVVNFQPGIGLQNYCPLTSPKASTAS